MSFNRRNLLAGGAATLASILGSSSKTDAKKNAVNDRSSEVIKIAFRTNKYSPPSNISIEVTPDSLKVPKQILAGKYINGRWEFNLKDNLIGQNINIVFLLDGNPYPGSSLNVTLGTDLIYEYDSSDVSLSLFDDLAKSGSKLTERLFPKYSTQQFFDVVVVGSGMGGGVLADELSDLGLNVAVVEAGSLLFPTHVGNLPRMTKLGRFTKHIWDLWYRYGTKNYILGKGSIYEGAQGFNVGGRSLFWGAFIPRMRPYEFQNWPRNVSSYLLEKGYDRAEKQLKKSSYQDCELQIETKRFLQKNFDDFHITDAPLAIDYARSGCEPTLPTGVFSTADLVMESILSGFESKINYPKVFQRHPAIKINTEGSKVTSITLLDLDNDKFIEIKGKAYVLAAGSQESAKLAINSKLKPTSIIGRGFSDHPIFYTHFGIPTTHSLYRTNQSAKVVLQDPSSTDTYHSFNMLLELGADMNHGRYVDPSTLSEQIQKRTHMLAEIVFLVDMSLDERNQLTMTDNKFYSKPLVSMLEPLNIKNIRDQLEPFHKKILEVLDARVLPDENLNLNLAPLGGVAHEVGTLRMAGSETDSKTKSVVNSDLRFHEYQNLWACDLSIFPSSPAANPSLTLVALALRLADHLKSLID